MDMVTIEKETFYQLLVICSEKTKTRKLNWMKRKFYSSLSRSFVSSEEPFRIDRTCFCQCLTQLFDFLSMLILWSLSSLVHYFSVHSPSNIFEILNMFMITEAPSLNGFATEETHSLL